MTDQTSTTTQMFDILTKFEARLDSTEKILANLVMGYAELAVAVEALMKRMVSSLDANEQRGFATEVVDLRAQLLTFMQRAVQEETDGHGDFSDVMDTFFGESVRNMAQGDQV